MKHLPSHFDLLLVMLAGWLNRRQQEVLDDLREENRVLREQLGPGKLRPTDRQRRRLAAKGKPLGRKLLGEWATIVTPDTILRWHRQLSVQKWAHGRGRPGHRAGLKRETEATIVRMAKENLTWGYRRIQGGMKALSRPLAHNTVKRVLQDHGIDPAPDRAKQTRWSCFLKAHWASLAATDFFTTEVWTKTGLVTIYTLFVIRLETRRVHIVGSTRHPDGRFVEQGALDLVAFDDSPLRDATHLIMDRDTKFTARWREILADAGVEPVRLPPRSPNLNSYAERFVKSIKTECLDRMIFFGQRHLEHAIKEYVTHHNAERPHQGLGNELLGDEVVPEEGRLRRRERLGGLLSFYHRAA